MIKSVIPQKRWSCKHWGGGASSKIEMLRKGLRNIEDMYCKRSTGVDCGLERSRADGETESAQCRMEPHGEQRLQRKRVDGAGRHSHL